MHNFLVNDNLIENDQHGSRPGRGTLKQLIDQHDKITNLLLEGKDVNLIYLDFSKAFDLVDHGVLLMKMKNKGFSDKILG